MAAKPTRLTHKIAIQLHFVADSCTVCSTYLQQMKIMANDVNNIAKKAFAKPAYSGWNCTSPLLFLLLSRQQNIEQKHNMKECLVQFGSKSCITHRVSYRNIDRLKCECTERLLYVVCVRACVLRGPYFDGRMYS